MTAATHTEYQYIANKVINYIDKLNGESTGFEIEYAGYLVCFNYEAEVGEDEGDDTTAPSWWVVRESVEIVEVWDEDGNECPEMAEAIAEALKEMFN